MKLINNICSRHGLARAASKHLIALTLAFLALPCLLSAQTLQYDWSFNEPSGSTAATDSVAGATITLYGGTSLGSGVLTLSGTTGDYAQFPNGILSTNNSITIETWLTDNGGLTWARAWSFGGSTTGPNLNFIQNNYIDLIPKSGPGPLWTEFKQGGTVDAQSPAQLPTGTEEYTVVTYDQPSQTVRLYLNGVQVAKATGVTISPASLGFTYNNFIGLDQWDDAAFHGTFDEMRIWTAPVTQRYLSASAVAGPSVLINNLAPTSVSVTAGHSVVITGTEQATVNVTLPQTGATELLATADATNWVSSAPSILTVNSNGVVTAVGIGSATVSATVAGVTATSGSITVSPLALLHRYSFASDASDSVGGANGTLVAPNGGNAATISSGLILPGNTHGGFGYSGYVSLPSGILTNTSSLTVECWATQVQGNGWATIWDFANNNNVNFGLIPFPQNNSSKLEVAVNPNNNDIYTASSVLFPNNSEQYVAYIFNDSTLTGTLYTNGTLIATQSYPDHSYTPANIGGAGGTTTNALGNDIYGDWQFDGTIYEFRIWNGIVTPIYLAVAATAGPGVVITNTTLQSLSLLVTTTSMIGSQAQQATVLGNFLQVGGVPVTGLATNWTSSKPSVLTVNSSGLITAQSGGTATVSATVNGVTATSPTITVSSTPPTPTQSPSNETVIVHDGAVFSVVAVGGNLNYQWSFNGTPISGATSTNLTLVNVAFTQAGTYSVLVSNSAGTTNLSATLTVIPASLQHEWSFNEVSGTTAFDSIENSNITLQGTTSLGGGVVTMPGGGGNYAQFPNGMLSTYSNSITIETWLTDTAGSTWARAWSFGGSTTGPNSGGGQNNYIDLIPTAGASGGLWTEFRQSYNTQDVIDYGNTPMPTGVEQYITVTYNASLQTCTMYSNGVQIAVGTGIATTPASFGFTYNNYLGFDQWNDATFTGSFDEMRIWNGVVSQLYLHASAVAGPNVVITNMVPTSISVSAAANTVISGTEQATVIVQLLQTGSANLDATADATNWVSGNPAVLTVDGSGLITGVGVGNTTVSATVNGVTATSGLIAVTGPQALLHRYSFVSDATDSVGGAPWMGTLVPAGGGTNATISNGLTLPGGGGGGYSGYLSLPNGILTNTSSLTVECWMTQASANDWATPWAFAVQPGVNFALIPHPNAVNENNGNMVVADNPNNNDIYTTSGVAFPNGSEQYVAYIFNNSTLTGSLYTNGVLVGTQAYPDHTYCPGSIGGPSGTTQNWLGNDTYNDTQFQGTIYEFRIWNGAVTPAYLAASAVAGTSVVITNSTPQSVSVSVTTAMIAGQHQQAMATGNFIQVSSVPLNGAVTNWTSSNPGVLTVNSSGLITAVNTGNATVSATVSGVTGISSSITVSPLTFSVVRSGSNLVLNWPAGILLQAPTVNGPWTTNNAASPPSFTVSPTNGTEFFRILIP